MNSLITYLEGIMKDCDGSPSSKRWFTFLFVVMFVVAFVANTFFKLAVDPEILHAIMYIIIAGVGFTGAEKFAPKGS